MNLNKQLLTGLLLCCSLAILSGQDYSDNFELKFDSQRLSPQRDSFIMIVNDSVQGFMVMDVKINGDKLFLYDDTVWETKKITESSITQLNRHALEIESHDVTGVFGGTAIDFKYLWDGDQVQISQIMSKGEEKQTNSDTLTFDQNTFERTAVLFAMIPCMELTLGAGYNFNSFLVLNGQAKHSRLKVTGEKQVTVPVGTFDTFVIEYIIPGYVSNQLYVKKDYPHYPVRIDVLGGDPMHFELVSSQ